MKLYLEGTPDELNNFLYGDSRLSEQTAEEDDTNSGDDIAPTVNSSCDPVDELVGELGAALVHYFSNTHKPTK